ncbi:integral membrane protein [Tothia fuscella]|uniref:Integral membrane protein n=1 Tax=Tothia fuscella TaxID=1048955 RepID=A0A9P4NHL6_9PEZI|nr:integral membrane protein [Tothia fuscella]
MKRWRTISGLLALAISATHAAEITLDQKPDNTQRCSGMYSKKSWGGSVDPFIDVLFVKDEAAGDATVSLVIFEYQDKQLLGRPNGDDTDEKIYICDEVAITNNQCNATHKGEFLLAEDADSKSKLPIYTTSAKLSEQKPYHYPITRTGYYCVGTWGTGDQNYKAIVEFRNAYGELPAAQIAKLPFYGGLTLVYAVMGMFWGFLYAQNRHDILPVQNYITAIIIFLVVEMLMTWGFYDYQNVHGSNIGAKVFMIIVSILNAGRNSFSFFLLLIVCMGYGVVKDSLGKTMIMVRWLAAAHFVFGVIYAVASLTIHPDDAGPLVLLVILPLSATLTAFYIWTLNSLSLTMKDLIHRKQHVKAMMYKKLWWCILASILVIFAFFFFNSFTFVGVGNDDFAPTHWQTRWFVLDGWLNLVYLTDVAFVAYLWRPTANNRRFAMSDELAQDDEGFEIDSVRNSLDDSDLENGESRAKVRTPSDSVPSSTGSGEGGSRSSAPPPYDRHRDVSPLPAPKPTKPATLPRESLDGDTIFAVGEDEDKWSDDEADGEEREGLVGKGK